MKSFAPIDEDQDLITREWIKDNISQVPALRKAVRREALRITEHKKVVVKKAVPIDTMETGVVYFAHGGNFCYKIRVQYTSPTRLDFIHPISALEFALLGFERTYNKIIWNKGYKDKAGCVQSYLKNAEGDAYAVITGGAKWTSEDTEVFVYGKASSNAITKINGNIKAVWNISSSETKSPHFTVSNGRTLCIAPPLLGHFGTASLDEYANYLGKIPKYKISIYRSQRGCRIGNHFRKVKKWTIPRKHQGIEDAVFYNKGLYHRNYTIRMFRVYRKKTSIWFEERKIRKESYPRL